MSVVLAFDTSAAHCAAALLDGGRVVAERFEEMKKGQAERLFPMLEDVLGDADATWADLGAIGAGVGPGNFTGIRIAVSAARGLALSLGIKAVGVSCLQALAWDTGGVVIASLAAPRGQVFAQVFEPKAAGEPMCGAPETLELDAPARAEPACIGASAAIFAERYSGHVRQASWPLASAIGMIAAARLGNDEIPSPKPLYIRPPDAAPASDPPPVILP